MYCPQCGHAMIIESESDKRIIYICINCKHMQIENKD